MKIHKMEQGSQEWHDIRRGKLTASRASVLRVGGAGLLSLCYEKVAEQLTGRTIEHYVNAAMEHGQIMEEPARNRYELETGEKVHQVGFVELENGIGCSPDGLVGDDGLIEIKCPQQNTYAKYLHLKKIDKKYIDQMQMQMFICGRKWCDYVVFNEDFKKDICITRVNADEDLQMKIMDGAGIGISQIEIILEQLKLVRLR